MRNPIRNRTQLPFEHSATAATPSHSDTSTEPSGRHATTSRFDERFRHTDLVQHRRHQTVTVTEPTSISVGEWAQSGSQYCRRDVGREDRVSDDSNELLAVGVRTGKILDGPLDRRHWETVDGVDV